MKGKNANRQTRLYLISAVVLLVGVSIAVLLYVTAENAAGDAVDYDLVNGTAYAVAPESSKRHVHDLELYGGKAAVLADEFSRWFTGLWRGTSLAYSVAGIAVLLSAGFILAAHLEIADLESDAADKSGQIKTTKRQ